MLRSVFLLAILSLTTAIASAQQPPVAVKEAVAPQYPPIAVAARIEGKVVVQVEIGSDGVVLTTKVVSGPEILRQSAIETAKKWKFADDPSTNRISFVKFIYGLFSVADPDETETVFLPPDTVMIKHRPMKTTVNYAY
jgi:TonB family protein